MKNSSDTMSAGALFTTIICFHFSLFKWLHSVLKNTFYRNQILPLHTPENQYFNPLIEEVILEMPPPYHLPRDKESL